MSGTALGDRIVPRRCGAADAPRAAHCLGAEHWRGERARGIAHPPCPGRGVGWPQG